MPKIFREIPPIEFVEEYIKIVGIRGLHDNTWFSKACINLDKAEVLFPELEPYYLPCKADILHNSLTHGRVITIMRQLLTSHGFKLISKEKTCGHIKGTWYQIHSTMSREILMDFS